MEMNELRKKEKKEEGSKRQDWELLEWTGRSMVREEEKEEEEERMTEAKKERERREEKERKKERECALEPYN